MKGLAYSSRNNLCNYRTFKSSTKSLYRILIFHVNPFWIHLAYFVLVSLVGHLALKVSMPKTSSFKPTNIDIFFTSVSASTVSSMSTVEMEVFSNTQLITMTILMLVGGEVFTSMLGLHFNRSKLRIQTNPKTINSLELVPVSAPTQFSNPKRETDIESHDIKSSSNPDGLKHSSMKILGYAVLGYHLVHHIGCSGIVALYVGLVSSTREVLSKKGIQIQTFATFTVVSTFANCGFVPTNENMIVFKKNSGLLLILVLVTLLGNTLHAPSLRFLIWVLEKVTKREEYRYMLKNSEEMGYSHLKSSVKSWCLVFTVFGLLFVQFIVFCSMEWNNSEMMDGLSFSQKLGAVLFQVVSTRHSGESVVDLSRLSPAILVIFTVIMYLPPHTSFLPTKQDEEVPSDKESTREKKTLLQCLLFSHPSYLAIFITLICIVEREKLKTDPLNFNVFNITLEVISAYGNVGYSTGYSCARQLKPDSSCKDAWYGLVGRWSNFGKFILIIVMFFGRLKQFSMNGGKAWKLS